MVTLSQGKILITGAHGFLGWHLRLRLLEQGYTNVVAIGREDWGQLTDIAKDVGVVFHLAGINREADDVVEKGNLELAERLHREFETHKPKKIIYANTVHAATDTPYGRGKSAAADYLRAWMEASGGSFVDVRLPNLFGEHGRPFYNSFVATFVELVVTGKSPEIQDREVSLLHAQDAAQALVYAASSEQGVTEPQGTPVLVSEVWRILTEQNAQYGEGEIPDIAVPLHRDLFNTLRTRIFEDRPGITLTKNTDLRGTFVETARVRGGQGQTSFSTTMAGVTRGNHFHLRKAERFVVLAGRARISLAKVFGAPKDRIDLDVNGDEPTAVDMPVGWAHNITNIGEGTLITQFWISELYDSEEPDTIQCDVKFPSANNAASRAV